MKKEIDFLKKNIENNSTVIVACSGGPDSMCLLNLVNSLKETMNLNVIVAHVDHNVRKESKEEAKMVESYALNNNLTFELMEIISYNNDTFSENEARKKRYDFFKELQKKYNASILLTAHHGDDLIETILMRLTRGSNLNGYIGIREITTNQNFKILRPLLTTTKKDIIKYLDENNINYAIDKTNDEMIHTRNRYRKIILPFLKKENPLVHEKYLKFSKELIEYDKFVTSYIKSKNFIQDDKILIIKLKDESDFIKRKCLEIIIKELQKNDYFDISDEQINLLMRLYNLSNKSVDLNNNYQGINSYGKIFIRKKEISFKKEIILDKDTEYGNFRFYYNINAMNKSNSCIALDTTTIKLPLKIRTIQEKDRMNVKNLNGSKKVSDIFINSKVPKYEREGYPILVDSNDEILWIPNIKKSKFAKDKSEKYDIIIKCEAR